MSGPSRDIALKKSSEIFGAGWEFLSSISDLMEIQGHHWIDQPAHDNSPISARRQPKRWNNRDALPGLYHRNLRIEGVQKKSGLRNNRGLREMLVDQLLERTGRWHRNQGLSFQRRPCGRGTTQRRVVVGTYHHQGKAKKRRPPNTRRRAKNAQPHIEFASLNPSHDRGEVFIEQLNSQVGALSVEFFDCLRQYVGRDQGRRAERYRLACFFDGLSNTRHSSIKFQQIPSRNCEEFASLSRQRDMAGRPIK